MADAATVAPLGSALTPAELLVLDTMCEVATEADAARRLGLSPHTVHVHLRNARSRLGVKTTRQAIVKIAAYHVRGVAASV